MARQAGALGVLVLTGETTKAEAEGHSPAPDLIASGLAEFGERLAAARKGPKTIRGSARKEAVIQ